jgi:predicted TIM-barrel enzyme
LRNLIESLGAYVKILIVSHIHESVVNEQNLVTAVQHSRLPVDCVFITTERTGELGKLRTLKSVTDGQIIISDYYPEILAEFQDTTWISWPA